MTSTNPCSPSPEWPKGLEKITLDPSHPAQSFFELYVWWTLQSSEHQNDQTQKQFLLSGNPSHEHLTIIMVTHTIYTLSLHSVAHNIPV